MRGVGFSMRTSNTGDRFTAPIVGIVGYDFSNFMLEVLTPPTRVADGVTREVTAAPGPQVSSLPSPPSTSKTSTPGDSAVRLHDGRTDV